MLHIPKLLLLNYVFQNTELIFNKYVDIYNCLIYNEYEGNIDIFVTDNFSNLTLGKFLQLVSLINDSEVYLMKWLLKKNIGRSTGILNRAAFWWNTENFIWLYDQGFSFNQQTLENAIRGNKVNTVRFLIEKGCVFNATYQLCNLAYEYNYYKMLQFLTSHQMNFNFDNRYIIKSIINDNYIMFMHLYENYSYISNYIFTNENNELYNKRLHDFINKYKSDNIIESSTKRLKT